MGRPQPGQARWYERWRPILHMSVRQSCVILPAQTSFRDCISTPNSGSFIRPTAPGISYGQSFLAALTAKYVEENHGPNETVVLGSSNGAIEVEVANLDMIRGNLARLETLREVSVEDVSSVDPPGDIRKKTPSMCYYPLTASFTHSVNGQYRHKRARLIGQPSAQLGHGCIDHCRAASVGTSLLKVKTSHTQLLGSPYADCNTLLSTAARA